MMGSQMTFYERGGTTFFSTPKQIYRLFISFSIASRRARAPPSHPDESPHPIHESPKLTSVRKLPLESRCSRLVRMPTMDATSLTQKFRVCERVCSGLAIQARKRVETVTLPELQVYDSYRTYQQLLDYIPHAQKGYQEYSRVLEDTRYELIVSRARTSKAAEGNSCCRGRPTQGSARQAKAGWRMECIPWR